VTYGQGGAARVDASTCERPLVRRLGETPEPPGTAIFQFNHERGTGQSVPDPHHHARPARLGFTLTQIRYFNIGANGGRAAGTVLVSTTRSPASRRARLSRVARVRASFFINPTGAATLSGAKLRDHLVRHDPARRHARREQQRHGATWPAVLARNFDPRRDRAPSRVRSPSWASASRGLGGPSPGSAARRPRLRKSQA